MKLGFLTACLPDATLEQVADTAQALGYQTLEVAVWPALGNRPFTATHLAVEELTQAQADDVNAMLAARGLSISALAYYDNNSHPDPDERAAVNGHVRKMVEAAALLGVECAGTFVGRDPQLSVPGSLAVAEKAFAPLVDRAGELGVKLMIENCVMEGWHPDGYPGNLAYSPELWEWMFGIGLYLNFDPSHLMWIGIDPVEVVAPYIDRIPHWQAKDVELDPRARNRFGHYGPAVRRDDPWDMGWWRYRVPGLGQVDWARLIDRFYEAGYRGVVSVEHEDPVWGGTPDKVVTGLKVAHRTLSGLVLDGV